MLKARMFHYEIHLMKSSPNPDADLEVGSGTLKCPNREMSAVNQAVSSFSQIRGKCQKHFWAFYSNEGFSPAIESRPRSNLGRCRAARIPP